MLHTELPYNLLSDLYLLEPIGDDFNLYIGRKSELDDVEIKDGKAYSKTFMMCIRSNIVYRDEDVIIHEAYNNISLIKVRTGFTLTTLGLKLIVALLFVFQDTHHSNPNIRYRRGYKSSVDWLFFKQVFHIAKQFELDITTVWEVLNIDRKHGSLIKDWIESDLTPVELRRAVKPKDQP